MHYLSQRQAVQTAQGDCLLVTLLNKHHVSCLLECPRVSQSPVHSFLGSAGLLRVSLVYFKVLLSAWCKGKCITCSSHIRVVVAVWEIIAHPSLKITYPNILPLSGSSSHFHTLDERQQVCLEWAPLTQRFTGIYYDCDSCFGCGSSWHYNLPNDGVHTIVSVSGRWNTW